VTFLIANYERERTSPGLAPDKTVKWDAELDSYRQRGIPIRFDNRQIVAANYRPFVQALLYYDRHLNGRVYRSREAFGDGHEQNESVTLMGDSTGKPYFALAVDRIPDGNFVSPGSGGTQTVPRYRYVGAERLDNVTDWALEQFTAHYGRKPPITKDDIFHYVYAVLHDPVYRDTYALNLRREFPRIPFYPDFARWAGWGKALMDLHIGYEGVEPWPLKRTDLPIRGGEPLRKGKSKDLFEKKAAPSAKREADTPKPRLKADKDHGIIELDSQTQLSGVPPEAWTYRLGNRSALEWVLDQHKEKKPSDPTIREKFDTYRFADHKERVIELLGRVTRVSVETVAITDAMRALPASARGAIGKQAAE
jgi:predicted helicase